MKIKNPGPKKSKSLSLLALVFVVQVVLFQNCGPMTNFSGAPKAQSSGNGDAYTGKPDPYRYFDSASPCADLDRNGKPLPNDQIQYQRSLVTTGLDPFLVREQCADLATPAPIASSEIQPIGGSTSSFMYKSKLFSNQVVPAEFDVVAAACPAGLTPRTGVSRSNLFAFGQDWMNIGSPGWFIHQGIGVDLYGSINSVKSFQVRRNNASFLEDWRRVSQFQTLAANTRYAYSFLARPGTVSKATFHVVRNGPPANESLSVTFDVQNGGAVVDWAVNFSNVTFTSNPVGNGYFTTVYFTTSASANLTSSDLGVAPSTNGATSGAFGDSINATAAQLERVGDFCQ